MLYSTVNLDTKDAKKLSFGQLARLARHRRMTESYLTINGFIVAD